MDKPESDIKRDKIKKASIVDEMKRSYLNYAMSVIVSRALPDIRDGLKPVHRRILFAMYDMGLRSTARFSKSAKVVGEVLGKYHPHGDSPVYDALVRMAQTFSMRYPLINGQGNFGSMDGDPPAAFRYTEVKLTKIAEELLFDIEKETIEFQDNFDSTLKEPLVLPAKLPNLLLMGSEGIAVGMATRIPPHNLKEIVSGICFMIDQAKTIKETDINQESLSSTIEYIPPLKHEYNQFIDEKQIDIQKKQYVSLEVTLDQIMDYITGPDFPTGANIYGIEEIRQMYASGKGKVLVRASIEHEEIKNGRDAIVISQLPYQTNKANLVLKIADLVRDKKIQGIADLRDESDRDGVRVVIELKRDAIYKKIVNNLYKHTELQTTYPANMVVLVNGTPQTASLKLILEHYLRHRITVIKNRAIWQLKASLYRAHILEGLLKALDHIDEIVNIIKKSKDEQEAKIKLISKFLFSDIQAQAILDMQLKRLTGLEKAKLEAEYNSLTKQIQKLETLVSNVMYILKEIKDELTEIINKYEDKRRTRIVKYIPGKFTDEELIENKEVIVTITNEGYIKTVPRGTFKIQNRGGKGVSGIETKEEDNVKYITTAMMHDSILFFTNFGKVYMVRIWDIPKGTRISKGKALINILPLSADEIVTSILTFSQEYVKSKSQYYIFMCTRKGRVKKTALSNFSNIKKTGIIAIRLQKDDQLQWVNLTDGNHNIFISTSLGKSITFKESGVRPMGRSTMGVIGIQLSAKDYVSSMDIIDPKIKDLYHFALCEKGIGKKTSVRLFPIQRRGGKGVKIANLDERTGHIAFSAVIPPEKEAVIITSKKGQVVRIPIKGIPKLSRVAKGVILMRFSKQNDFVASATFL